MSTTSPQTPAAAAAPDAPPLPLEYEKADTSAINPWLFVPVLYFMQFLPNGVVTSLFGPIYLSLGVDVQQIATWTGLAALPWTFKMFWGPLVDLNSTKRRWTITMEVMIAVTLLVTAGVMATPAFFVLTVIAMFILGTLSATHDIACDGLYLMSLDKKRQAAFSGVMATFSRMGRLFIDSVLLVLAGRFVAWGMSQQNSWVTALGILGVIYGAGTLWNMFVLPRPAKDVPVADVAEGERLKNIWRTLTIVAAGVAAYFVVASCVELLGYGIFRQLHGTTYDQAMAITDAAAKKTAIAALPPTKVPIKWHMTGDEMKVLLKTLGYGALALVPLLWLIRVQVRGTTMGDAFASYFKQPGFPAIFAFIMFYRFGEAMVFAMAALFIMDAPANGGMGQSLEQVGLIKGIGQFGGLTLGGLLGGWWISKVGLRKAFWPLVVCMHVPNILYVWAAYELPRPIWLYPVVFIEAFGYGVGFAGYFVYLMHVAQRGRFTTSHYAIGTGLGALFITFATIFSGIVYTIWGYKGVFVAACLFTIPGTLTLLFIPMDEEETKKLKAAGDH